MTLQTFIAKSPATPVTAAWLNRLDISTQERLLESVTVTGTVNAILLTVPLAGAEFVLTSGSIFTFIPSGSNTGAVTINGAAVINELGNPCTGGEFSVPVRVRYNGTQWQLVNPTITAGLARTASEIAASVIPTNYLYLPYYHLRYGGDDTGTISSTSAIQQAINAANATRGGNTVYIVGKPRITAALTYTTQIAFVGTSGGDTFTNSFDTYPTRITCGDVTGYVFSQPGVGDGSGGISSTNICWDGRTGAGARSTTLQGIVTNTNTAGQASFYLRFNGGMVGNTLNTSAILFNLTGQVFCRFENFMFSTVWFGMAVKSGGVAGVLGTTFTFNKCYHTGFRQIAEYNSGITDVTYSDCVMESCVTGVASAYNVVTYNNLYSENMGFDASGSSITTGVTARSLGLTDAPTITGNVKAVFTCRAGQQVFNQPNIMATLGGMKWWDGIGRANTTFAGGEFVINDLNLGVGTLSTLFAADSDVPSSRGSFEYKLTMKNTPANLCGLADARLITKGRVPIAWSDGTVRPVDVDSGLLTLPSLTAANGGLTTLTGPTVYPDSAGSLVGDVIYVAADSLASAKPLSFMCTTAGAPGKWDTKEFVPYSISAAVAAAGVLNIPVQNSLIETGYIYIYEVNGTVAAANALNVSYTVHIGLFASGSGMVAIRNVDTGTTTFAYTHGNPLAITNGNAFTMTYYVRLIALARTHT